MGIPAALLNELAQLADIIPSYRGLQVIIISSGQPVIFTTLLLPDTDGDVSTSLRVPLSLFAPDHDHRSRVIFYGSTPGAFVDLAADLGYALQAAVTAFHTDVEAPPTLVLDGDLPLNVEVSGVTGLSELAAINVALGILIDQGYSTDHAYQILRRAAATAGVETHVYAARMLRR